MTPQAQDSLTEQMRRVHRLAHQYGEWDAADWIANVFFENWATDRAASVNQLVPVCVAAVREGLPNGDAGDLDLEALVRIVLRVALENPDV